MSVAGIVVAAGAGSRFGSPKQEVLLVDRPLWQWARDALVAGGVSEVVVVGPVPGGVAGGVRRRDSVAAGLRHIPADAGVVVVHDAARPLATAELVRRVLDRLEAGDVDGVVPALPLTDAVKEVADDQVVGTVDRSRLVTVQTPQAFVTEALRGAHQATGEDVPDDAALVERQGGRVAVVEGERANLKITYPDDLRLAEGLLR